MLKYILICCSLVFIGNNAVANTSNQEKIILNSSTAGGLTEKEKVEHLIQYLHTMKGATFIRNGSEHSCAEAAQHLRSKWEKHRSKIKTAEDFIEQLAAKSGMSGKDYQIRLANGEVVTTKEVLMSELRRIENQ